MTHGTDLIVEERKRQVEEEHYTSTHDMTHEEDDLACAGAWYALPQSVRDAIEGSAEISAHWVIWPEQWDFKPTPNDRVRELVKAGALIAAEIDRLS